MAIRYSIGDKVLASRDESGENHEPGKVVDAYELLIGEDRQEMVVIEFEDGERKYMTAKTPNVLPVEEEEEEGDEEDDAESEDDREAEDDDGWDEDEEVEEAVLHDDGEFYVDEDEEGASP
jgi:hypothetical protein